jgi:hypothetical protein
MADRETELREHLAALNRRYYDEAAPIIDELTKIEAMKPHVPLHVQMREANEAMLRHINARWPNSLIAEMAAGMTCRQAAGQESLDPSDAIITRTWQDEADGINVERSAPEDFYAKPEDEQP